MWGTLHNDPNTSRLLKKIYGGTPANISYPKVKTASKATLPSKDTSGDRIYHRSKKHNVNDEIARRVQVPKFRGSKSAKPPSIDAAIVRRKRGHVIMDEQAAIREQVENYRPPYTKLVGDNEKARLAEKFACGGGKALPEEMTCPTVPISSEERWKASEAARIAHAVQRRQGVGEIAPNRLNVEGKWKATNGTPAMNMFDQVASEIEERQEYLLKARESGFPCENESLILAQISQRMSELECLYT